MEYRLFDYLKKIDYRITEGMVPDHLFDYFGDNVYQYIHLHEVNNKCVYEFNVVFDTVDRSVYMLSFIDYNSEIEHSWINPDLSDGIIPNAIFTDGDVEIIDDLNTFLNIADSIILTTV
jgi:hypothetical protein